VKVHYDPPSDIVRYIDDHKHIKLEDKESDFRSILKIIRTVRAINHETKILEIGTGTGWFPILCALEGIPCKGLEISPQLVEYARWFGRHYGAEPDIEIGNIEEVDVGVSRYDVVVATATFEHVDNWQRGLTIIFDALKPGGVLYFYSTNKFSFRSGEYDFPLYGWWPNSVRYSLRKARQGDDIMKLGIDFNQFTHGQLRRFFKKLGFARILDRVDVLDPDNLNNPTFYKKATLRLLKACTPLRHCVLCFSHGTLFVCVK
jgi:2-polyprenyl-3-methyl-5-hydroxy-6-metoxy-1,4-benzoquinol methylase